MAEQEGRGEKTCFCLLPSIFSDVLEKVTQPIKNCKSAKLTKMKYVGNLSMQIK